MGSSRDLTAEEDKDHSDLRASAPSDLFINTSASAPRSTTRASKSTHRFSSPPPRFIPTKSGHLHPPNQGPFPSTMVYCIACSFQIPVLLLRPPDSGQRTFFLFFDEPEQGQAPSRQPVFFSKCQAPVFWRSIYRNFMPWMQRCPPTEYPIRLAGTFS
jgi:hypothetical protein